MQLTLGGDVGADGSEGQAGDMVADRVLLLSPSRGLGGGIERYVATLEWAFAAEGVPCLRLDLNGPGPGSHARLLALGRANLRAGSEPTRLVVAHRTLLPVAAVLGRGEEHSRKEVTLLQEAFDRDIGGEG